VVLLLLPFTRDKEELFHRVSKIWFRRFIIPASLLQVEVRGLKNIPHEPVIFVSNHQSSVDIAMLLAYLPGSFRFIVKQEYFKVPFLGWYTKFAGHLPIDRLEGIEAQKTLDKARQSLKEGKSLMIFPEGTRSPDGRLKPFKRGSLKLAFETRRPVVPIAISGSFEVLPRESFLINPGKIRLTIGKPMSFVAKEKVSKKDYVEALEKVRNTIASMLSEPL